MKRRGHRIIELTWECSSCHHVNKGRHTQCQSCGSPKEADEKDIMPGDSTKVASVTDAERLREANAGANWVCEYCGSQERNLNGSCRNCAGKKDMDSFHPEARETKRYHPEQDMKPGTPIRRNDDFTSSFDRYEVDFEFARQRKTRMIKIASIIGGIALVVGLLLWIFMPYEVNAEVTGIHWEHTVNLEQRFLKHGNDWDGNMPSDAHNVKCVTKFKEYERCNPHDCNPHQVSYDCRPHDCNCRESCSPSGNGYASCTTTCSTCYDTWYRTEYDTCYDQCPVYDEWCSFDYHEWDVIKTNVVGGTTHEEHWPDFPTNGRSDLRNTHKGEYEVKFYSQEKDKTWDYKPDDLEEFRKYNTGAPWLIKVNRAGLVWPQNEL